MPVPIAHPKPLQYMSAFTYFVGGFVFIHTLPGVGFFDENKMLQKNANNLYDILLLSTIMVNIYRIFTCMLCAHVYVHMCDHTCLKC